MKKDYKYIIYSPFINTGGGKTLLFQLLNEIQNYPNSLVIIDLRISFNFKKNKKCDVLFTRNTLFSFIHIVMNKNKIEKNNTIFIIQNGLHH